MTQKPASRKTKATVSANQKFAALCVLLAGCFWGTTGIFVRHFDAAGMNAAEIGEVRITCGLLLVGCYLGIFNRDALRIKLKDIWCFLGTGVGSLLLMMITHFSAMQYASIATASVLLYTAPAFVMLLSAFLFREPITRRKLLSLLLAFLGCALVSGVGTSAHASARGILLGLASGLTYALYTIFGRFAIRKGYTAWTVTFYSFLLCALFGALLCNWPRMINVLSAQGGIAWCAGMGLITAFAPFLLYSTGLRCLENGKASVLASAEPVTASLISVLLFREPMGLMSALGIVLVFTAIVLLSTNKTGSSRREKHDGTHI